MPRSSHITWSKWFTCDRCGRDYPVKYRRHQNGLAVCTYIPDYDAPGYKAPPVRPTVPKRSPLNGPDPS